MSTAESPAEDVVVYKYNEYKGSGCKPALPSVGRDTLAVAKAFCGHPKWPYDRDDSFVAVDDWGHGTCVAATQDLAEMVGLPYRDVCRKLQVS